MKWVLALMLCLSDTIWAADTTFRGRFYWGHEVQSFQPCNSKKAYWVEGNKGTLRALRDRTEQLGEKRGKPYQPIYVEAVGVIDTKTKREGFAGDYDGLFHLHKVVRISDTLPKNCAK